jgi:Na+-driven multidrug efflux pump
MENWFLLVTGWAGSAITDSGQLASFTLPLLGMLDRILSEYRSEINLVFLRGADPLTNGPDGLTCRPMDTIVRAHPKSSLPSYRYLFIFFIPLALSNSMMTLEPLIISPFLSHASNSEVVLAAYNVMYGISILIEAPVLMLISTSNALVRTRDAFRVLSRFTLALGSATVAVAFLVSLTPLYDLLVSDLMNIPPAVAEATRPGLIIMSIWSFPISWRRMLQGVLIAHNRTPTVTLGTIIRLLALVGALTIGGQLMPDRMLVVSALAMQVSVIAEALVVIAPALRIVREMPAGPGERPLSRRGLLRFYQPLAITMILRQIARPILSAGIAAAQFPQRSLAAWSVAWSLVLLPFGVTLGLEQVVIAKGGSLGSSTRVRRFTLGVGLVLSAVLVLIVFTPLVYAVLEFLFELTPEIELLVILALRWTALLPLLQSLQAMLRGSAIGGDRTPDVRTAVTISLAATALVAVLGPRVSVATGVIIGATATMLAALAEVGWLAWRERAAA